MLPVLYYLEVELDFNDQSLVKFTGCSGSSSDTPEVETNKSNVNGLSRVKVESWSGFSDDAPGSRTTFVRNIMMKFHYL